jgi:hypothetical protein
MNRDDIIHMAQEIAAQYMKAERFQTWTHGYMMERLMELVAAEREACLNCYSPDDTATDWADKIRARSNT